MGVVGIIIVVTLLVLFYLFVGIFTFRSFAAYAGQDCGEGAAVLVLAGGLFWFIGIPVFLLYLITRPAFAWVVADKPFHPLDTFFGNLGKKHRGEKIS